MHETAPGTTTPTHSVCRVPGLRALQSTAGLQPQEQTRELGTGIHSCESWMSDSAVVGYRPGLGEWLACCLTVVSPQDISSDCLMPAAGMTVAEGFIATGSEFAVVLQVYCLADRHHGQKKGAFPLSAGR